MPLPAFAWAWVTVAALIGLFAVTHALAPQSFARVAGTCAAVWLAIGAISALYLH